jgi:FAD/FMN-containing dehydrogenase
MIEHSGVPTVVTPDDPGYDDARMIFNRSVDKRPARVVRCSSAADVAAAVRGAREDGLPLAVRAGGHNFGGHAQVEGGVVIDLRGLTTIEVDPDARRVVTGTGLRWAEYDAATAKHGLATPGGSISTVGVSGFTLGTGLGWLSRHRGLAHDNLVAAELVTAYGEVVAVDDDTDPELMWALRGGCGNVGAVTAMHFAAHPQSSVVAGTLLVDIDRAGEALRAVSDLGPLPAELSWTAVIVQVPPAGPFPPELAGRPALMVNVMVDDDAGLGALDRMRAAVPAVADTVTTHPYPAFQQLADPSAPWGACWDVRSEWLRPLGDTEIGALVQAAREARSPLFEIVLRPLGGAIADRAADATAFSFRHADLLIEVIAGWFPGDPDAAAHRAWMTRTWESVLSRSCGGADVNHLGLDETPEHVRSAWSPGTYARLQQVKRRVDPDEVFTSTQRVHLD